MKRVLFLWSWLTFSQPGRRIIEKIQALHFVRPILMKNLHRKARWRGLFIQKDRVLEIRFL